MGEKYEYLFDEMFKDDCWVRYLIFILKLLENY